MTHDEIANPYQETSGENDHCDRDRPTLPERSDAGGNANDKAEDRLREICPTIQPTCAISPATQATTEGSGE